MSIENSAAAKKTELTMGTHAQLQQVVIFRGRETYPQLEVHTLQSILHHTRIVTICSGSTHGFAHVPAEQPVT